MLSLDAQTRRPDELVIAWMQDAPHDDLPAIGLPVRHVIVPGEPMPLAAARNRAAEVATGETLVFLDVDCVASPTLVASYVAAAEAHPRALFLGEVLYLPGGAIEGPLDFGRLDAVGVRHPAKPAMPASGTRREPDAGELWGLSFALARADYRAIGGMDEGFVGYGGEETDFAARLAAAGIEFRWTAAARAYHQHHAVHVPPLHQFEAILRNAARFHARHGRWCMDYWLGQFRDAGLIDWHAAADRIVPLADPSPEAIARSRQADDRLFS